MIENLVPCTEFEIQEHTVVQQTVRQTEMADMNMDI